MSRRPTGRERRPIVSRRVAAPAPDELLDYSQSTFTRASEASAFDPRIGAWDGGLAAWPGTDVPIIYADGSIRIEGARTNLMRHTSDLSDAVYTKAGTPPTISSTTAPDGAAANCRITPSSSSDLVSDTGVDPASTTIAFSAFARDAVGSSRAWRMNYRTPAAANVDAAMTAATGTWGRRSLTPTDHGTRAGWRNDAGGGTGAIDVWGMQVEDGALFPSSPIRTTGATATRALDACSFATPPAAILSGHWSLSVWPGYASSEAPATAYLLYLDADNYLAVVSGTTIRLRAGGANYDVTGLSYARHAQLAIDVDHGALMTITGGGGGSVALTNTWAGSTEDLSIGSDGSANHAFAVIGRPVRA